MNIAQAQTNDRDISATIPANSLTAAPESAYFGNIAAVAAAIFRTPPACTGIIDVQGKFSPFQAGNSLDGATDFSAFVTNELIIVPDLAGDKQFSDHACVTGAPYLAFYAGAPLMDSEGSLLGTLSIWDSKPAPASAEQRQSFAALAAIVSGHLHRQNFITEQSNKIEELKEANADLDSFANLAAHDLKSPLNAIISLTHLLKSNHTAKLDEEGNEYVSFLNGAANNLTKLISGILQYSRSTQVLTEQQEDIVFKDLLEEIISLAGIPRSVSVRYAKTDGIIHTSRIALRQILMNLIDNAVRHNEGSKLTVNVSFAEGPDEYTIKVNDNGAGIPDNEKNKVFDLLKTLQKKNTEGKDINVGLAIVKKLVDKLNGSIAFESELDKGATFIITLPK